MLLGIGVDIVSIARVERLLERHGARFTARIFTARELEDCAEGGRMAERLGGRFAAKEAFVKALGTGVSRGVRLIEIEVRREPGQRPQIVLHGATAKIAASLGAGAIHCSISHDAGMAVGMAVIEARAQNSEQEAVSKRPGSLPSAPC